MRWNWGGVRCILRWISGGLVVLWAGIQVEKVLELAENEMEVFVETGGENGGVGGEGGIGGE